MINKILYVVGIIITALQLAVSFVELKIGAGNGAEKKKLALQEIKNLISMVPEIPDWIKNNLLNDTILSYLIDAMVGILNSVSFFVKSAS